jgi:hypothetical protein
VFIRTTSVSLVAACWVFTGCGGGDGSRNEGALADSGQLRDVVVANDGGDASAGEGAADGEDGDGSSCGPGSGAFVVGVGNVTGAGCECDWYAMGAGASAASGSVDTLDGFSVTCVPAGNYEVECSCGPTGITGPPDADEGYCTGGAAPFSVSPGATTNNVAVDVECPE